LAIRAINTDPIRNFKFHVQIYHNLGMYGGMTHLGFMSATGLASTTEVISYREGGDNTTPRKMPGQTDFPPVSLTRGLVKSNHADSKGSDYDLGLLWQWYRQVFFVTQGGVPHGMTSSEHGSPDVGANDFKCEVVIKVFDHPVTNGNGYFSDGKMGPPRVAFKLFNCWPASLAFSDLDAGGNGVMVNNLTLMYEGFDIVTNTFLAAGVTG
jgi:phage tail-like protein